MDLDRASVPRSVQCFFQPLQSVYSSRDCKVDFKLRGGVGRPPPLATGLLSYMYIGVAFLKMALRCPDIKTCARRYG